MLLGVLLAMTTQMADPGISFYVGTYTDSGGGQGIYQARLNPKTGAITKPILVAKATAPSYLCMGRGGKFLYAVDEYSEGEVTAFAVVPNSLRKINSVKFEGSGACHVSIDSSSKWLAVSSYGAGVLTILPINGDGSLGEPSDQFKSSGSGPNRKRQASSHIHFAMFLGRHLYACDLGTDQVLHFEFESKTGKLNPGESGRTEPGAGPRHFAASSDGKFLYVNNEMGMGVSVFARDIVTGSLRLIQTHASLDAEPIKPGWSTSAVRLHPKLPMLYISNRGPNSISRFEILRDGSLAWRSTADLDVIEPRDFAIDPGGKWLITAGQKSGELQSYSIDSKTGELTPSGQKVKIPKPVCIVFAA